MDRLHAMVGIGVLVTLLAGLVVGIMPARAAEEDDQIAIIKKYLDAYVRRDGAVLRKYTPDKAENLFGKYPFQGELKLGQVKVDEHQALIDFTAKTADNKFPTKGGLLLFWRDNKWRVRQVLYYDTVPRLLRLPSRSVTTKDKAAEPTVEDVGKKFVAAWKQNDYQRMKELWFDWPAAAKEPRQYLRISNVKVTRHNSAWNDPYMHYSAKLSYHFGPLSYSIKLQGGLLMVKENGNWLVRPLQFVFKF